MRFSSFTFAAVVSLSLPVWVFADPSLRAPTTGPTIDLTPDNLPAVSAADAVDAVREGTHFVDRTGRLNHTPDGQHAILVFDNQPAATPSPAMIVLPNWILFSMESFTTTRAVAVDFRISGTVTEYKGRNYILLDNAHTTPVPAVAAASVSLSRPQPKASQPQPTTPPPATVSVMGEPALTKMERLLAQPPDAGQELPAVFDSAPATNLATGKAAVAPDAPVLKVLREGTHLINRIGRLNHTSDGQKAIFTFDADGKTMADPPIIILPNLKLLSMEGQVLGRAGDLHFRVSGTVTEYKGRNYILLDKAVAIADVETQF